MISIAEQKTVTGNKVAISDNPYQKLSKQFGDEMDDVNRLILSHMNSEVALVKQISAYLIMAGGKRVRPLLTLAFADLCGGVNNSAKQLAAAVEFIHTATLLHDDVVDESAKRRGQPSVNSEHGNKLPVLVGDFLFSRSFQLMVASGDMAALKILSDASAVIAEGEVLQLAVHGQLDITQDSHFKVLEGKTAALFAAACESGALIAGGSQEQVSAAKAFGLSLGMAFQITDDVLDYTRAPSSDGKNPGDDFFEGKVTLPVLIAYSIADSEEKAFWEKTFKAESRSQEDFEKALAYLQKASALSQANDIAQNYCKTAEHSLSEFESGSLTDLLSEILSQTLKRDN